MKLAELGSAALQVAVVFLAIVGFAMASPSTSPLARVNAPQLTPLNPPAPVAAYLAAYARGDEVAADRVSSPLYRVEWARRGLSVARRQALLPTTPTSNGSGTWVTFTFVGGAIDWRGFGHLLYVARPSGAIANAPNSAWRVDTDPSGRVIWIELVYLFSVEGDGITPVRGGEDVRQLSWPNAVSQQQPRLIAGARATGGKEGYYAVAVPSPTADPAKGPADIAVMFFGVDEHGGMRPGAWTYGADVGPSDYGNRPIPRVVPMDPDVGALERSYVETL